MSIKIYIELTSYVDDKQNVWFKGKDIVLILVKVTQIRL